ncbi:phosphate acetyltransferase [Luteimicrobium subarcticum]|uniref:Phosphate acetyltransferase n=1 Tax=Luteimicrobium subarcticum TaxID=620910 RepID=A0A2M8WVA6_9MICO|nr:phosphate acetyltransferase [Luteimicrobium subarcticum]PJI94853.1 phosphate acetyltransferase [Luteimicrobium subarcticum]
MSPTAARSVFVASAEGDTGKSTVALGVLSVLSVRTQRVGVFRPIARSADADPATGRGDYVLDVLLSRTTAGLEYEQCLGVTYDEVHRDPEAALARIVQRYHEVAAQCDAVVVLGSDYTDVAGPTELAFNARIAANLGTPVMLVLRGLDREPAEVRSLAEVCLAELRANHARPFGIVVNRCAPDDVDALRDAVAGIVPAPASDPLPAWAIAEDASLSAPTVQALTAAVQGTLAVGEDDLLAREALTVLVGAMTFEHVLDHLSDGAVVITPGDRSDVVVGLLAAHAAVGFPSLAGLILTGGQYPPEPVASLIDALSPKLPVITTGLDTFEAARRASRTRGRITLDSSTKVDTALALFERAAGTGTFEASLDVRRSDVVTPLMFEYDLLSRARADRRHVVLPEGGDDRILRAASTLLQRGVAELTILGDEVPIRARAAELGLRLDDAHVLSTHDPELVDRFAEEYTTIRAHKGMTVDRAREIVTGASYFGTMMVHLGLADGMVSGAAHTTAHTIKPSFEIVKTAPGVSVVSSVFLMCLQDRVLVYGDCAVIPDPTSEQLADIAISSAATARQFGVDPRIAMLSYSTGESGSGADVDKVRAATALVRERRPDLSVAGPIQYDAAVDASVAASKMPGSDVAGKATVFVFPDLNTGNNTYKAVQRSAGAVAIGPVLQGLAKPVNDLSRGALVQDIVNTVAITAIQAQSQSQSAPGGNA